MKDAENDKNVRTDDSFFPLVNPSDRIQTGMEDEDFKESKPDGITADQLSSETADAAKKFVQRDYNFTDFHQGLYSDQYYWSERFEQELEYDIVQDYNWN